MLDASNLGANMLNVETLHEKLLHKLTVQLSDSAAQRQATELEHKAIQESNAFAIAMQKFKHDESMRKTELEYQVKMAAIEATQRNQVKPVNEQELQQKATVESNAFAMHLAAAQVTNGIQPNQVKPANDCVRSSPCDWSVEDVAQWLGDKHCTRDVIEKFKENQVCGSTLTCMSDEVMQEHILPWFSVLHRDKFVEMMKILKTSK